MRSSDEAPILLGPDVANRFLSQGSAQVRQIAADLRSVVESQSGVELPIEVDGRTYMASSLASGQMAIFRELTREELDRQGRPEVSRGYVVAAFLDQDRPVIRATSEEPNDPEPERDEHQPERDEPEPEHKGPESVRSDESYTGILSVRTYDPEVDEEVAPSIHIGAPDPSEHEVPEEVTVQAGIDPPEDDQVIREMKWAQIREFEDLEHEEHEP